MYWLLNIVVLLVICGILFFAGSLLCFMLVFYSSNKPEKEKYPIPDGEIYEVYREDMIRWIDETRATPHRNVSIVSKDGITLRAKYYEFHKGAPVEILLHGYRGSALRDLSGGVARCRELGHNALIPDHRGCGESDGHVITFGIKEREDALLWLDLVVKELSPDTDIILTGISMGAATVLMCADKKLPENVIGILADCGYTSPKAIIKKIMRQLHLPSFILYPMVRAGALIFGRFDIESASPIESVKNSRYPIIFFHGEDDTFVPCEMSEENYAACPTRKHLVKVSGAGHGLAFPADREGYFTELRNFFGRSEIKNGTTSTLQ